MTKIITISGPSSSGKTTLANELIEDLFHSCHFGVDRIIYITEIVRDVFKKYFSNIYPTLNSLIYNGPFVMFQRTIFAEYLNRLEKAKLKNPDLIICDRGIVDIYVYTLMGGSIREPSYKDLIQDLEDNLGNEDLILYCDDLGIYKEDGFRADLYKENRQLEIILFDRLIDTIDCLVYGPKIMDLPNALSSRIKQSKNEILRLLEN